MGDVYDDEGDQIMNNVNSAIASNENSCTNHESKRTEDISNDITEQRQSLLPISQKLQFTASASQLQIEQQSLQQKDSASQEHLIICSVVLENFKSYGGRHVIGPFHRRFSSIVGPNGSGKSNIIDAMLFVFGRRAQQLRHKKIADLIHRSASIKNCEYAKVAIHFEKIIDDSTVEIGYQILPGSCFIISREAFIDGSSRYSINDRTVTQKDVVALLKSQGVDLDHNRFLILQGEIEQIALMNPKGHNPNEEGLLEYLEYIIGSNRLIPQIETTKEELEKIAEVVQEKREKMQSASSHVESLKGPLRLAEQLCESERKLLTLKAQLEVKTSMEVSQELQKAQTSYDDVKTKWNEWKADRSNDKKEMEGLESALKKQTQIVVKAEKLLKAADEEFSELERRDNELTANQTHCIKRAQTLEKESSKLGIEKSKCEQLAKQLKNKADILRVEVPQLHERVELMTSELEALERELQSEFDPLRKQKEKIDNKLQREVVNLEQIKASAEMMKTKAQLIEEKQEIARRQQISIQEKLKSSQQHLSDRKTLLDENQKSTEKLKKAFVKKSAEMSFLRDEYVKQRDEIQQSRQQLEVKEVQRNRSKTESTLIPKILQAKENGTLRGVIDRLWNLGAVDEKLENAFAAIANSEILVVEQTEDARAVVEFVRRHNLGRITCIVLDRVKEELFPELRELRRKKFPPGSKLLLDLVNVTNREYEVAFYFVLKDTLLVSTLDEARKVAFNGSKRWKVVTLDGQVIDRSGTMTGGMSAKQDDRTSVFKQRGPSNRGTIDEAREIERLKISIAEKEGKLNVLKDKKAHAETELDDLDQRLNELDQQRARLAAEVDSAKQDVEHYKTKLTSSEIPELTDAEKTELQQLSQQVNVKVTEQQETVRTIQDEIERITQAIQAVGGEKRNKLRSQLEASTVELQRQQKELKDADVQSEVNRKRAEKLETTIPEKRAEYEAEMEASRDYEKAKDALTDQAELVLKRKEDIEKVLEEQKALEMERSKALKGRLEESKKYGLKEVEFQTTLSDLEQVLQGVRNVYKKHQKQMRKFQEQWEMIPFISAIDGSEVVTDEEDRLIESRSLKIEYTDEELNGVDRILIECEIKKLTESMASLKIDLSILDKYRAASAKLKEKTAEFEEICVHREKKAKELDQLQFQRLKQFSTGFVIIAGGVKELYQMITQEGDAELELADPSNPFSCGVIFSVRPPRKSWKRVQNLSGGEKTLSSLALVFALHRYRPTPIYFLDEIDAALDHRNVSTIALYIANQANDAQFIIISLRHHMFELADRLVGIYKTHGITKTTTIDPDDFVESNEKGAVQDENLETDAVEGTLFSSSIVVQRS